METENPITTFVDTVRDDDDTDVIVGSPVVEEITEGGREKYYESVGRRKEAIARVRLATRKATDQVAIDHVLIIINGQPHTRYFQNATLQNRVESPLKRLKSLTRFKASVLVSGGGSVGQAEAIRHGISRALERFDANFRKKLKKAGFLTRDARIKERRKPGLKKARKAPRWSKR